MLNVLLLSRYTTTICIFPHAGLCICQKNKKRQSSTYGITIIYNKNIGALYIRSYYVYQIYSYVCSLRLPICISILLYFLPLDHVDSLAIQWLSCWHYVLAPSVSIFIFSLSPHIRLYTRIVLSCSNHAVERCSIFTFCPVSCRWIRIECGRAFAAYPIEIRRRSSTKRSCRYAFFLSFIFGFSLSFSNKPSSIEQSKYIGS